MKAHGSHMLGIVQCSHIITYGYDYFQGQISGFWHLVGVYIVFIHSKLLKKLLFTGTIFCEIGQILNCIRKVP